MLQIKNMTPEDRFLFLFTRQEFSDSHYQLAHDLCRTSALKWNVVYVTAETHGVAPLVYSNITKHQEIKSIIPKNIILKFELCRFLNSIRKEKMAKDLGIVLSFFKRKSIDVMLVKGMALDIAVYQSPAHTISHDVDIISRCKASELPAQTKDQIWELTRRIPWLEHDYFEHHDITMNGILPLDFNLIWQNAKKVQFGSHEVFIMSPEDMLLSSCVNSCRRRFFNLKALCDISEITRTHENLLWQVFVSSALKSQCNNLVHAALLTARMTVGCEVPEWVMNELSPSMIRRKLTDWLARRMSFSTLPSLHSGIKVFDKKIGSSLVLGSLNLTPGQMIKNVRTSIRLARYYSKKRLFPHH